MMGGNIARAGLVFTRGGAARLTRRRGVISSRGDAENAEVRRAQRVWFWVCGAAETSRRHQGSLVVVVCSGRVTVRGVKPASPGSLPGEMSTDSTGRNHIHS